METLIKIIQHDGRALKLPHEVKGNKTEASVIEKIRTSSRMGPPGTRERIRSESPFEEVRKNLINWLGNGQKVKKPVIVLAEDGLAITGTKMFVQENNPKQTFWLIIWFYYCMSC